MEQDKKELCSIRIMFPVESDAEAIEIKAKIKEVLSDKQDAQLHFMITPSMPRPQP